MKSDQKQRMTRQRKIILEEVQNGMAHLTADEVYERVRKSLPKISMGTVYRNLDVLATAGLIKKLEPHYSQMRFDGNLGEHYHIVCTRCGTISDADIEPSDNTIEKLENALGNLTRYGIFGHKLEFLGLCPKCLEQEKDLSDRDLRSVILEEVLCEGPTGESD